MNDKEQIDPILNQEQAADLVRQLSHKDFLKIGVDQVAYIKLIDGPTDHGFTFAVHAADGTQLSIMDSYDMALAAVQVNDLQLVTVH